MGRDMQLKVQEFHEKFGVDIEDMPKMPCKKVQDLRVRLIQEELDELADANLRGTIVDVADALGDLLYVVFGSCVSYGIDITPVFNEIHRSNMTKLTKEGKVLRREDGKIIKPNTYEPAKIKELIEFQIQYMTERKKKGKG